MARAKTPRAKKPEPFYNRGKIQDMLVFNDRAVLRAVVAIYKLQTDEEKNAETTKESNGRGFTGVDAPILSSFAKQILQRGTLSHKQLDMARRKMMKYWRQLAAIAECNDLRKQEIQDKRITAEVTAYQRSFKFEEAHQ